MRKAALYIRVSTLHQIDKYSLPMQKADLIAFCKMIGIDEYEVFIDAGYSGKNTDRPAFLQMMQRVRKKEFTHVLVWKIDRISRNLLDFAKMYEELRKYDVTFVSRNEQFDTSTAMGEAMLKIILIFAELERKMTSERVLATMIDRAKKGLWNGARIPFGYRWDEEQKFPVPDEKEAEIVQMIFDMYEEEKSTTYVMKYLLAHGIETKRGGKWTTKTLSDMIRNQLYKGTYVYNMRESARGKKKPEDEWVSVDVPGTMIIVPDQWERCNDIMSRNAAAKWCGAPGSRVTKYSNIFAGLLICGKCGSNFIASGKDKANMYGFRPTRYICNNRSKLGIETCDNTARSDIPIGTVVINVIHQILTLDPTVSTRDEIQAHMLDCKPLKRIKKINPDGLDSLISMSKVCGHNLYSGHNKKLLQAKSDIDKLKKERARYEKALDRLEDMYLFDDMSEKRFMAKKKQIAEKLNDVNNKILEVTDSTGEDIAFINDLSMMNNISGFFLKEDLSAPGVIDFRKLSGICDDKVLKKFINSVVDQIVLLDGNVVDISFKNGLDLRFEY